MSSNRIKSEARRHMLDHPGMSYREAVRGVIALRESTAAAVPQSAPVDFPQIPTPPNWPVAQNIVESISGYRGWKFYPGVDRNGAPVGLSPEKYPHTLFVGSTGSGKSVNLRNAVEQHRAAGWQIFIADGRGTEWAAWAGRANVVSISDKTLGHIATVRSVRELLEQRREHAAKAARRGELRELVPPVLLVISEGAAIQEMARYNFPREFARMNDDLLAIAALGREHRIHLMVDVYDLTARTMPHALLKEFSAVIATGKPHAMTMRKVLDGAPDEVRLAAEATAEGITHRHRGRSMIITRDEIRGFELSEVQTYFSYDPGEHVPYIRERMGSYGDQIGDAWEAFKTNVSDVIPKLYPRQWVVLGSEPLGKEPRITGPGFVPFVNIGGKGEDDVRSFEVVMLDDADGNPIADNIVHDPHSGSYAVAELSHSGDRWWEEAGEARMLVVQDEYHAAVESGSPGVLTIGEAYDIMKPSLNLNRRPRTLRSRIGGFRRRSGSE